jgi:hypothetical protein
VRLERNADDDAKVGSSTFQCPQQVVFIVGAHGISGSMLTWDISDTEDLSGVDADHYSTNNGITRETMKSRQVSDAAL